ncbi:uncharacterized protein LOC114951811 [Acropora millepora]|uniref:uncharacterized protein LOC114951811 n=1 Tax=Acropora millepora TaxID=45264 RepID=UPI001CF5AED4|nr:uncharacterized protein LOC114951811 [Acropora millepora]
MEGILGRMIEQYCLNPFLNEQLCYRTPLSETRSIGRPSYIITKEQIEIMRSYALSWVEIAKALGSKEWLEVFVPRTSDTKRLLLFQYRHVRGTHKRVENEEEDAYHKMACLERRCVQCGVHLMELLPEEASNEGAVIWSRYEYVSTEKFLANGQEEKKLALVTKETPPSQMIGYFKDLKDYPLHSFMAKWQREQLDTLLEYLPLDHVVAIHDYSEGYTCRSQDETQSEYFDVAKVSLHVTILYRHSTEKNDGIESTEENPEVVKEHVFVISDDVIQDNNSVHEVQELLNTYITKDLGQQITVLHEFTDGCLVQYKSRHCLGDLSCCVADFGYKIQRNFFETSHAKDEQDAAGSHVKQKVTQAVLRRTAAIKSAKDVTGSVSR